MKTLLPQSLRTALFARIKGDQSAPNAKLKAEEILTVLDGEVIWQAVMQSRDSIAIADASTADFPLVMVNPAFEKLTGYRREEILGRNCRFLQGADRAQRNISAVRQGLQDARYSRGLLRNYRKNGSMFWNELSISPVFDRHHAVTHFIGIQNDVTARITREQRQAAQRLILEHDNASLEDRVTHDALTGVYTRRYFEERLHQRWAQLVNTREALVVMFIDVDDFKLFNDCYGHLAGDQALKNVAAALKRSLRRANEVVARFGGEEFIVLADQMSREDAIKQGEALCQRVRNLGIPHQRSPQSVLTISCGIAVIQPDNAETPGACLRYADHALYQAKERGKDQVVLFGE